MKLPHIAIIPVLALTLAGCTIPFTPDEEIFTLESGDYNFSMDVSSVHLSGGQCPSQAGSVASAGTASVTTADDASTITMNLDSQTVLFNKLGDNEYESDLSSFPVMDAEGNPATGTVFFELTVTGPTSATGSTNWDNLQGCQGFYPFTLTQ